MSQLGSPMDPLASSLYSALLQDLKPRLVAGWEYTKPTDGSIPQRVTTGITREYRPGASDVTVVLFPQTWPSTSLGFSGLGGQAFTSAYTVIVHGPQGDYAVYFGGRFAYHIDLANDAFYHDMRDHSMAAVAQAGKYRKTQT